MTDYDLTEQQGQNATEIHDTDRCQCEFCLWADRQERKSRGEGAQIDFHVAEDLSGVKIDSSSVYASRIGIQDSTDTAPLPDFDSDWSLASRSMTNYVERSIAHYWWLRGRQAGIEETIRAQNGDLREAARLRGLVREVVR